MQNSAIQKEQAVHLLKAEGIVRLREFRDAGIAAAAVYQLVEDGVVVRLRRGLYQLASTPRFNAHTLAMAAKLAPTGVVCLTSALWYHKLIDREPGRLWYAIGENDWVPKSYYPRIRFVRFAEPFLKDGVITMEIEGAPVRIFNIAKTLADCFKHRRLVDTQTALEGLILTLERWQVKPYEIAEAARRRGSSEIMRPYMDALLMNSKW